MQVPKPRAQLKYQKPKRINTVSMTLTALLALFVWVGVSFWPQLILRSNVKTELFDTLPTLWKLNLRPDPQARVEMPKLRRQLIERLRKIGVRDDKLDVIIERSKQRVGLRATFTVQAQLQGFDRKFAIAMSPSAETDAARVDW